MNFEKFLIILWIFFTTSAFSTNYYFSESLGNDSWSGTLAIPNNNRTDGPKRSLTALNSLMNNVAKPGDSIFLRRGDRWTGSTGITIGAAQGTPSNYIFIGAYGTGNKPVIDKTGAGEVLLCRASANAAASYLKFQNLALTSSSSIGNRPVGAYINEAFYTLRPHHIILDSLHISNCISGMILYQENIVVENCLLEKNGNEGTGHGIFSSANHVVFRNNVLDSNGCGNFFVHTMYISQCTDVLFEGNEIKNADDGLKLRSSNDLVIRNNIIHDMYTHTIHVGGDSGSGTKNVVIEGNLLYNVPQGIEIKSESGVQTLLSENIIIRNNILPAQVIVSNTSPVKDIFIYNNLIYSSNNQNALLYMNAVNPVNVQIKNNIFYKTTSNANHSLVSILSTSGLTGVRLDHNLYYFQSGGNILRVGNNNYTTLNSFRSAFPNYEINGQQGNPNFSGAPLDFHLTSASTLAIDKGVDATGIVPMDIEGMARPLDGDGINGSSWDIGPYEYCCFTVSSETIARKNEFEIYPNPAIDEITINTSKETPEKIVIIDNSGKIAFETNQTSMQNNFSTKHFNKGMYFVLLFMKSGIISSKLVLIK